MVLYTCWYQMTLNYPIPSLFTVPQIKTTPLFTGSYDSLWCQKVSWLKKDLLQEGHTNPTPKCTLHTFAEMVAHEVDGPSLQPSTWHLYTHLTPPSWMWRGCILAGITSSEAGSTAGEADCIAWPAGSETSGPVDSWRGRWGTMVDGVWQTFLWGGEAKDVEGCNTGPLRSPLKTLHLWAYHCCFHLPQPLSLQMLGFHF